MRFYWLVLAILAVWRITHLFYAEDGPWDMMLRLRKAAGDGFWGRLLDCFYCMSVWVALPFAFFIGESLAERLLLWPAISGGVCLLERKTRRDEEIPPVYYLEDKEEENGLLRREKTSIQN